MNIISNSSYYSLKYMLTVILFYLINKVIGIPSLYTVIFAIPFINYLILLWSLIRPLEGNTIIKKDDIFIPFLIITSLFNLIFFNVENFNTEIVVIVLITNAIELVCMKPKK